MTETTRKELEEKYNICLDWKVENNAAKDLYKYFKEDIEQDHIVIPAVYCNPCCHITDFQDMRMKFEKKLKEFPDYYQEPCNDPDKIGCSRMKDTIVHISNKGRLTLEWVNKSVSVRCPVCRTKNLSKNIKIIKGVSETCSVCLDKPVEIFFGNCGHAPVCTSCYKALVGNLY